MNVWWCRALAGTFVHRYFDIYDSDLFYVIAIHTICDNPCNDSVELGSCQIYRFFNRFSTCVCTVFGLGCTAFLCNGYFEIRTSYVLGWIPTSVLRPGTQMLRRASSAFSGWGVQLYLAPRLHWHRTSITAGISSRLIYPKSGMKRRHQDIVL